MGQDRLETGRPFPESTYRLIFTCVADANSSEPQWESPSIFRITANNALDMSLPDNFRVLHDRDCKGKPNSHTIKTFTALQY